MPIVFSCPLCGEANTMADQYAGCRSACAVCRGAIIIPMPAGHVRPALGHHARPVTLDD
jgi:hypothetical protein